MAMTLYGSPASPFARTVTIVVHELGLADDVAIEATAVKPTAPNVEFQALNPLRRVPALGLEDGSVIVDSPVICEYLADRVGDTRLFAKGSPDHWHVMSDYAIARQMAELAVSCRYEQAVRPEDKQWAAWVDDAFDKIGAGLARFDAAPPSRGRLTIADIALGVTLDYLAFRFASYDWPSRAPALGLWLEPLSTRPSFAATRPSG